jgi:tetratricopeptide (TPR) repeat protein
LVCSIFISHSFEHFCHGHTVATNLGEYQKAIEDYDQAITLNPQYARAFYNRGATYRKLGKKEKAIEDFKKAQELDPGIVIEEAEKTQASNKKAQDFQEILETLETKHQEEENNWFKWSKYAIKVTSVLIVLVIILIAYGVFKSSDTYIIYVFSSVVTLAIIRQYTNAKSLRIVLNGFLILA